MENTKVIIECIDNYLDYSGESFITPPEANELLEKKGILKDRKDRRGLPLRKLLRSDKIPHAYKEGRLWRIPHSKIRS